MLDAAARPPATSETRCWRRAPAGLNPQLRQHRARRRTGAARADRGRARRRQRDVVEALLNDAVGPARRRRWPTSCRYVVDFVRDEARERGRDGALMFDDLILRTRDLLRDRHRRARYASASATTRC